MTQTSSFGTTWRTDSYFQGAQNQASYVGNGIPYHTASQVDPSGSYVRIDFPRITQEVTVKNIDRYYATNGQASGNAPLAVFFGTENPSNTPPEQIQNHHAYYLENVNDEKTFEVRTNHIYVANMSGFGGSSKVTGSFNISAELAKVNKQSLGFELTGSGINDINNQ